MSVTLALSVDVLTVSAAWMAGLAIVALVLTGWRKPARAQPRSRRDDGWIPVPVDHQPGQTYRRPGPVRRLLAALASGGLAVVMGAVIAVVVSFAVAFTVIRLTGLLTR